MTTKNHLRINTGTDDDNAIPIANDNNNATTTSSIDRDDLCTNFQAMSDDDYHNQQPLHQPIDMTSREGTGLISASYDSSSSTSKQQQLSNNKKNNKVSPLQFESPHSSVSHSLSPKKRGGDFGKSSNCGGNLDEALRKTIVSSLYLSIFAVFGALLRIALAQLFGGECKNPGSVGWLAAGEPLCVTADGDAEQEGGIIFADMPANMLGCFIMGLMQSGSVLKLPANMPIVWLPITNEFQSWSILHLAIKTGFCGSLTTYSSWNSEMVVMMFGTGVNRKSQFFRAIFGFIVGMETSIGSYIFGKNLAVWLHRKVNPLLAKEADILSTSPTTCVNTNLPCFERRFLASIVDESELTASYRAEQSSSPVSELERWRNSTLKQRMIDCTHRNTIHEIETVVLVLHKAPGADLTEIALDHEWDLDALQRYEKIKRFGCSSSSSSHHSPRLQRQLQQSGESPSDKFFSLTYALSFASILLCVLCLIVIISNGDSAYAVTRRTAFYAALFAPFGALLRWKLSSLNGYLTDPNMSWLPVGTLSANALGSFVSILSIAAELRYGGGGGGGFWGMATVRAMRVGFAGCLSTVSTFIAEVCGLLDKLPDHMWGYTYILISLGSTSLLGVITYGLATINL